MSSQTDKLKEVITGLESEANELRKQLAVKQKAVDAAKNLMSLLRGGDIQESISRVLELTPKSGPSEPRSKYKHPRQVHFPYQSAQNALVEYAASHRGTYFTVKDAVGELLRQKVVPNVTSTTVKHVRELLNRDTVFFERSGVRDQTKYRGVM